MVNQQGPDYATALACVSSTLLALTSTHPVEPPSKTTQLINLIGLSIPLSHLNLPVQTLLNRVGTDQEAAGLYARGSVF